MAKLWWERGRAKSLARKWKRRQSVNTATIPWSPRRERWVRERAAAPSEANKACGRLDKRPTISSRSVRSKNALTFSNSFNEVRKLCLPSQTFCISLHMLASFPGSCVSHPRTSLGTRLCTCMTEKHVPRLLTNPRACCFKSHGDAREAYTANTYT